jgi:hypothetical protein
VTKKRDRGTRGVGTGCFAAVTSEQVAGDQWKKRGDQGRGGRDECRKAAVEMWLVASDQWKTVKMCYVSCADKIVASEGRRYEPYGLMLVAL